MHRKSKTIKTIKVLKKGKVMIKTDQKILDKYFEGNYDTTLQTPLKNVRAYLKGDKALFISTSKVKDRVSSIVALVASQKGWNLSINTEGSHLVCLLYP